MPDIQAHLPDGKTVLHFPNGTDPAIIDKVVKQQLGASPSPVQQIMAPGTMEPYPRQQGTWKQILGGVKEFGGGIADVPKSLPQFAEAGNKESVLGGWPENQAAQGPDYSARARQALTAGDPISFIGHAINAALALTMIPQTIEGLSQTAESNPMRAAGQLTGMGLMEKIAEPGDTRTGADLRAGVADRAYKRGLGVQDTLKSASDQIHDAVGESAQKFVSKLDKAHPEGAIDPKPVMDAVNQLKADIVKTPEKYPPGLAQMLEPEAPKSTGPRIMGGHMDLSDPAQLTSFQKLKAQGAFTPAEIARMEGGSTGMWTAEEAKQWRTKIGAAIGKTQGPMKSVLTEGYDNLTQQMRKAADDSGALQDFADYNNLHKKHMAFLNDSTVSKIMEGETSKDTLAPLSDPEKMAHLNNLLADWKKYGIDTEDLAKEGQDYGKAKGLMEKKGFRLWPAGTLSGAIGSHVLGVPWPVGAGAGIAVDRMMSGAGKASRYIENSEVNPFYRRGVNKAADISRGWSEDTPEISAKKVALKKAAGK